MGFDGKVAVGERENVIEVGSVTAKVAGGRGGGGGGGIEIGELVVEGVSEGRVGAEEATSEDVGVGYGSTRGDFPGVVGVEGSWAALAGSSVQVEKYTSVLDKGQGLVQFSRKSQKNVVC